MQKINDPEWGMIMNIAESAKDTLWMVSLSQEKLVPGVIVAFDFETEKLPGDNDDSVNPLADSMFSVSFSCDETDVYAFRLQKEGQWIYPEMVVNEITKLFNKLFDRGVTKIVHNLKFDSKLVYRITGKIPEVDDMSWDDTMIMAYLVDENRTAKLKSVAGRYLGIDTSKYESMLNAAGKITKIKDIDWFITAQYNCADSWMTRRLWGKLWDYLIGDGVDALYKNLYKPLSLVLLEAEIKGFRVDLDHLKARLKELEEDLSGKHKFMKELAGEKFSQYLEIMRNYLGVVKEDTNEEKDKRKKMEVTLDKISNIASNEFNPRSPIQLKALIMIMELDKFIEKKTVKGSLSLDKEVMEGLEKKDKTGFVSALLEYRKGEKTRGTIQGLIDRSVISNNNNLIHTNFLLHGTVTGRLSSKDPNLQNLPTGHMIRDAFIPREGRDLIVADFSQIELRVAAWYAQEPTMLKIFAEGKDIHSRTAMECFKVSGPENEVKVRHPELRRKAKIVNFGILYDMSDYALAKLLECTRDEAALYIERYYGAFANLKLLREKIIREVMETETVTNVFGRRRRFPGLAVAVSKFGKDDGEIAHQLREAFNALIQSTAVDICNLSIAKIRKKFNQLGLMVWLLAQVHDEMVWEPEKKDTEQAVAIIKEIAPNIIEGFDAPIDIKVCKHWGEK